MHLLTHSRFGQAALVVLLGMASVHEAGAQTPPVNVKVNNVKAAQIQDKNNKPMGWAVVATFDQNFNPGNPEDVAKATKSSSYRIIEIKTGAFVAVSQVSLIQATGLTVTRVRLVVPGPDSLNTKDLFHFYALDLTFNGAPARDPSQLQAPIEVKQQADTTRTATIDPQAPPKAAWSLAASKGKDDSDIYGAYDLTRSHGTPTTGSGDLKIAIPFSKRFWGRRSIFSPDFEIKADSNAEADPDSLKFAFDWLLPLHIGDDPNESFPFTIVNLLNSAVVEAPRDFDNINALWTSKWLFPSANLAGPGKRTKIFIDPFVGHEVGKNLKSPLKTAEGQGLARLITGANLNIKVPVNLKALKEFEFNTSYIRRWPLKRELLVDKDDGGNLVLLSLSKGPKDYSDSKFTVKINDFFGPFVGFEWGRLPPNYNLVDHKWTLGLLFKSKIKVE